MTVRAPRSEQSDGSVTGIVFDPAGAPAKKIAVFATANNSFKNAKTDDNGRFTIRGLSQGTWRLSAAPSYRENERWEARAEVEIVRGSECSVDLRPRAGVTIAGVVLDADGAPVAGAHAQGWISDDAKHDDDSLIEEMPTAADGTFRLRTLPAGKVTLIAYNEASRSKPVEINAPDEKIILKLEQANSVSGRVVDEAGAPVKEFSVIHWRFDAEDGRFKINSRAGKQSFAVDAVGYAQRVIHVEVKVGKNEIGDVKVSRGVHMTGLVFDAKTSAPIVGAIVDIKTAEPRGDSLLIKSRDAVRTDSKGRYTLTGDPNCPWVTATHPDYISAAVSRSADSRSVDLPMRSGATVAVTVMNSKGRRVHKADVWAFDDAEHDKMLEPTGAGTYSAKAFVAGAWTFKAASRDKTRTFETVKANIGESAQTLVIHELTGGIEITITTPSRAEWIMLAHGHVALDQVRALLAHNDVLRVTNGVAKHVRPGPWTVLAGTRTQVALHPIDVTENGPTKVDFTPSWQPMPR